MTVTPSGAVNHIAFDHRTDGPKCKENQLTQAKARIKVLEEIVGKLYVTRDKKPITLGMDVWRLLSEGDIIELQVRGIEYNERHGGVWITCREQDGTRSIYSPYDLCSTFDAASADAQGEAQ